MTTLRSKLLHIDRKALPPRPPAPPYESPRQRLIAQGLVRPRDADGTTPGPQPLTSDAIRERQRFVACRTIDEIELLSGRRMNVLAIVHSGEGLKPAVRIESIAPSGRTFAFTVPPSHVDRFLAAVAAARQALDELRREAETQTHRPGVPRGRTAP